MTAVGALPPSRRVGARIWIARIMLSWGIVSGAMAFIPQFASWTGFSPERQRSPRAFMIVSWKRRIPLAAGQVDCAAHGGPSNGAPAPT